MRTSILILLASIYATIVLGQSATFKKVYPAFNITYDINNFECKPFNNDKSFVVSGFSGNAVTLLKINSTGNLISNKQFSIEQYCNFFFNNNKTLSLYSFNWINKDLFKLDTSFNIISTKQYDSINSGWQDIPGLFHVDNSIICATKDKGYLLSGTKHYLISLIVKTDSLHNVSWGKYFTPIQGGIQDIVQTQDSGYAIAMNLENYGASLVKTDSSGNVLWCKSYFRPSGYIHNVLENTDGTMIITGSTDSSYVPSPLFFVKLGQSGSVIWAKSFGNNIGSTASYTKHTQDGGYITLTTILNNHGDLLLIKTDSNGDTLWVRAHGSPQSMEYGQSVEQLNDKGYIVCGITNNNIPVNLSSLYIVRTDSLGHTDSLCEEYSLPLEVNNITVNDSNISVTSVPFTVHTSAANTSTSGITTYAYDGCYLDAIPELYAEQTAPLLIYPNPTNGLFAIETKISTPIKTDIEIYNINSERVYSGYTSESLTNINLTGLANGLYFIRMSNDRWAKTGKVMVY